MKTTITISKSGPTGNIYCVLGLVQKEMRKQQRINDYNEARDKVFASKSYKDALTILRELVNIVEVD